MLESTGRGRTLFEWLFSQLSKTFKPAKTPRAQDPQHAPNSASTPAISFISFQHLSCAAIAFGAAVPRATPLPVLPSSRSKVRSAEWKGFWVVRISTLACGRWWRPGLAAECASTPSGVAGPCSSADTLPGGLFKIMATAGVTAPVLCRPVAATTPAAGEGLRFGLFLLQQACNSAGGPLHPPDPLFLLLLTLCSL